jgi:hypothetical protein
MRMTACTLILFSWLGCAWSEVVVVVPIRPYSEVGCYAGGSQEPRPFELKLKDGTDLGKVELVAVEKDYLLIRRAGEEKSSAFRVYRLKLPAKLNDAYPWSLELSRRKAVAAQQKQAAIDKRHLRASR